MKAIKNKTVELYEEWGKFRGRPYHVVWVYKKDKRYRLKKRRHYLKSEYLDELPYEKLNGLHL